MINLTSNAVKYTNEGEVLLGYERIGEEIRFFVSDTGIGIAEEELNSLFTRFKRVETEDSLKSQGTGLGLSIAKRIVELLGGEIGVQSDRGKGSEFYFHLPYQKPDNVPAGTGESVNKPIQNDPEWDQFKIVIAEDEEMNFLFLQEALRNTNIQIIWAKNGQEAIDKTLEIKPDLVLMDIKLPDFNGFEAIKRIREKRPGQIAIIQTAFAMADKEITQYAGLFDDVVTKPINRGVLINKMGKYLI